MKITKSQLKTIIKEEALKFKRAIELKKELSEIEKQLNEVKAGDVMGQGGVHAGQRKPVFASKGNPNLKMEDGIDDGDEDDMTASDADGVEVGSDVATDVASDTPIGGGDTISKAEVASAIAELEAKLGLGAEVAADLPGEEIGGEDVPAEDGDEEFEFDADEVDETAPAVAGAEPVKMEVTVKHEEGAKPEVAKEESTKEEGVKEEVKEEGETVKENLDEPIDGKSPVQVSKENKVGVPFVEKVKNVKEGEEVAEVKETIAEAEKKRMAFLAGILKG